MNDQFMAGALVASAIIAIGWMLYDVRERGLKRIEKSIDRLEERFNQRFEVMDQRVTNIRRSG